jgi:hypothetical protein
VAVSNAKKEFSTMADHHAATEKYRKELAKIDGQISRTEKRRRTLQESRWVVREKLRRAEAKCLIGKPVIISYRRRADEENVWLNDAVGTLTKVMRSWVLVDYGERGKWRIQLIHIQPAGETQGELLSSFLT